MSSIGLVRGVSEPAFMLAVIIYWFYNSALRTQKNVVVWSIFGVAGYFVPEQLSIFILVRLSIVAYVAVGKIISILVGLSCCFLIDHLFLRPGGDEQQPITGYFWYGPIDTVSHATAILNWTGYSFLSFAILAGTMGMLHSMSLGTLVLTIGLLGIPATALLTTKKVGAVITLLVVSIIMILIFIALAIGMSTDSRVHTAAKFFMIESSILPMALLIALSRRAMIAANALRRLQLQRAAQLQQHKDTK